MPWLYSMIPKVSGREFARALGQEDVEPVLVPAEEVVGLHVDLGELLPEAGHGLVHGLQLGRGAPLEAVGQGALHLARGGGPSGAVASGAAGGAEQRREAGGAHGSRPQRPQHLPPDRSVQHV